MENIRAKIAHLPPSTPHPPGRVRELRGIIFQSDSRSMLGSWFIRPLEMLDLRLAGLGKSPNAPSLAIHAGIHVVLENGQDYVVEQLFGSPREDFVNGLNWTPLETFHFRDHNGWDVTVPVAAFRGIDNTVVPEVIAFLNAIKGRPFFGEDCTSLVERAFGKRRLFADSPLAQKLGLGLRVGDPALPLLRSDVKLDSEAERLLRAELLRRLPDPTTSWNAPNARVHTKRVLTLLLTLAVLTAFACARAKGRRHKVPAG